jgi:glycosyltransferase involved in cell wall biosynthesis
VQWADQVFVVDSFSRDRTPEIAREYGAQVVQHAFENYARQKNWALECLPFQHDWVLILDADERVPPDLADDIAGAIRSSAFAGYYLNRRFIFLGTWIRHAGWYPSWNLRLFQHRRGRYEDRPVHEHVVLEGRAGYLPHDLLHVDRRPFSAFVDRHNRYSSFEAEARLAAEARRGGQGRLSPRLLGAPVERKRFLRERVWPRLPCKPLVLFVYMYLVRRGLLDGRAGLTLCVFHAWQEFVVGVKLEELRRAVTASEASL